MSDEVKNAEARIDLEMAEGASFSPRFRWKVEGLYVDLVAGSYTGRCQVRARINDTDTLLDLDSDAGFFISQDTSGLFGLDITPAMTDGICTNHRDIEGVYDLFLDTATTSVRKMYGTFKIKAAVTLVA